MVLFLIGLIESVGVFDLVFFDKKFFFVVFNDTSPSLLFQLGWESRSVPPSHLSFPSRPSLLSFLSPLFFSLTRRLPERTPSAQLTSGMPRRPGISSRPVASFIAELGSWRAPMISPFDAESLRFAAAAG